MSVFRGTYMSFYMNLENWSLLYINGMQSGKANGQILIIAKGIGE